MLYLIELFEKLGLMSELSWLLALLSTLMLLILASYLVFKAVDFLVNKGVRGWIKRTRNQWDNLLMEMKIIPRLSQLAPIMVISILSPILFAGVPEVAQTIDKLVVIYLIVVFVLIIEAVISFLHEVYQRNPISTGLPLTGLVQALKLVLFLLGTILIIAQIIGQSPLVLLSGFGAMTAVLLLIFREPILGLVAGIQLSANNMVRRGDWIQMDKYEADGDVIDITLTTVKVRNWDKTITSIPAYALIQNSFKNWRGIYEAGGRRIKRSIYIDLNSIQFLEKEVQEHFSNYRFLKNYLNEKKEDVESYNRQLGDIKNLRVDGRSLTNVGTFRAYCFAFLQNHLKINQDLTLMVRQLEPTPHGLPIQIYCFTKDTAWHLHEGVQSDLFDHFLAVLPEFNLRAFQQPSGLDLRALTPIKSGESGI